MNVVAHLTQSSLLKFVASHERKLVCLLWFSFVKLGSHCARELCFAEVLGTLKFLNVKQSSSRLSLDFTSLLDGRHLLYLWHLLHSPNFVCKDYCWHVRIHNLLLPRLDIFGVILNHYYILKE